MQERETRDISGSLLQERRDMINFEEELKKFVLIPELDDAEAAIYDRDLTDVTDIIAELLREQKSKDTGEEV